MCCNKYVESPVNRCGISRAWRYTLHAHEIVQGFCKVVHAWISWKRNADENFVLAVKSRKLRLERANRDWLQSNQAVWRGGWTKYCEFSYSTWKPLFWRALSQATLVCSRITFCALIGERTHVTCSRILPAVIPIPEDVWSFPKWFSPAKVTQFDVRLLNVHECERETNGIRLPARELLCSNVETASRPGTFLKQPENMDGTKTRSSLQLQTLNN